MLSLAVCRQDDHMVLCDQLGVKIWRPDDHVQCCHRGPLQERSQEPSTSCECGVRKRACVQLVMSAADFATTVTMQT